MIPAPTTDSWKESPMPSSNSQSDSPPPNPTANGDPPRSPRHRTVAKEIRRKPGPKSKPQPSDRERLQRKLGVTAEQLADSPQITPLLRRNGIRPRRVIEALRCDTEPESLAFVQFWDGLTAQQQKDITLEIAAFAAETTPRRLWELYQGATLIQAKESVAVMLAESLAPIMRKTIKQARYGRRVMDKQGNVLMVDDDSAQQIIYKAARILPTPKGSTTVINMPRGLGSGDEDDDGPQKSGDLESADDFLMKAAKAMHGKGLPPGPALDEAEIIDADELESE